MKNYFILLLILISRGNGYSQNSFYIVPSINTKFGVCSTNGFFAFSNHNYQNAYFDVYNKPMHFTNGVRLGLGAGWKNEKQKFSVDLTWNQDVASVANETVLISSNGESNYYFNKNLNYQLGFTSHRFSINLNKPLFRELVYLNAGIGFTVLPQGDENYEFVLDNDPFLLDSTSTLKIRYTTRAVSKTNLNLSIGLNFAVKWNDFYLFTLSTIYSQGVKRNLVVHENYYEVSDASANKTIKFSYSSAAKGSGLFIQVSRQFQLSRGKN